MSEQGQQGQGRESVGAIWTKEYKDKTTGETRHYLFIKLGEAMFVAFVNQNKDKLNKEKAERGDKPNSPDYRVYKSEVREAPAAGAAQSY